MQEPHSSGHANQDDQQYGLTHESDVFSLCAQCGSRVSPIKGSKSAVCENCGFRDSCC